MTNSKHRVLVVEDDVPTREELAEVLHPLGFEVVSCGDKQTALRHINEQAFCMALVDLQIFGDSGSNRAMETHGHALIKDIRTKYPERHSPMAWRLPILVVSGFAREGPESKEVILEGASDIVWKLPNGGLAAELSRRIEEQFRASGREDHADCCLTPLELSVPGERLRQTTKVMLGAHYTFLADRHLRVLLHLIKGKLTGVQVHNVDMQFKGQGGNRLPSELNKELRAMFPANITNVIKNDHRGSYSLIDAVTIGGIAYDRLIAIDDATITSLVSEIRRLQTPSDGNS